MPEHVSHERLEIVAGILLGIATVASTWCAYQATLWSGEQTRTLASANARQFESMRGTMAASRETIVDVMTFLSYMQAEERHDARAQDYIRTHARQDFRPALNAWIADKSPDATVPFKRPEYRNLEEEAALAAQHDATVDYAVANRANDTADVFVLHTVVLAMALFLLGAATQVKSRAAQRGLLAFGALVLVLTMTSMIRRPRAPHPYRLGGESSQKTPTTEDGP
jgi:hypothetical protein